MCVPPHPHPTPPGLQISKALLGEDQRIKLPRFLEDDAPKDPETTKQVRRAACGARRGACGGTMDCGLLYG